MSQMHGGGGSGSGSGFDPSNLHLKMELTQIRKATKVLKRSRDKLFLSVLFQLHQICGAMNAAASSSNHHHYHRKSNTAADPFQVKTNGGNSRDKKMFLYNWRIQRLSSEKSISTTMKSEEKRTRLDDDDGEDDDDDENDRSSSSIPKEIIEDSLSDARNSGGGGDSKSDTYIADQYASMKQAAMEANTMAGKVLCLAMDAGYM